MRQKVEADDALSKGVVRAGDRARAQRHTATNDAVVADLEGEGLLQLEFDIVIVDVEGSR